MTPSTQDQQKWKAMAEGIVNQWQMVDLHAVQNETAMGMLEERLATAFSSVAHESEKRGAEEVLRAAEAADLVCDHAYESCSCALDAARQVVEGMGNFPKITISEEPGQGSSVGANLTANGFPNPKYGDMIPCKNGCGEKIEYRYETHKMDLTHHDHFCTAIKP